MNIKYVDLGAQWTEIRDEALPEIDKVLQSGMYLEHPIVSELERKLETYLNVENVVTLNSGTDALILGLVALGVKSGDEIITVPNSFIASVAAIEHVGAKTVFVDVAEDHLIDPQKIENAITSKTAGIMPVHLEGKMADMPTIKKIADKYGLKIIEDAAQAFGSHINGQMPGSNSDISCFSLHPLKNLNALGDGGFIATKNKDIAERISILRTHGQKLRNVSDEFGVVSRLDSIQAAVLNIKLNYLNSTILRRRNFAAMYDAKLKNLNLKLPEVKSNIFHSYHLYVIEVEDRDRVQAYLAKAGIETKIHYPTLISDQLAFTKKYQNSDFDITNARAQSKKILSLPIHQNLNEESIEYVATKIQEAL